MSDSLLDHVPVVPVVVVDDPDDAVPLARALVEGGLPVIELTLRTPAALEAMSRISASVPEILLGAGTVVTPHQAKLAADAGAQFLVSPGATPSLLAGLRDTGLPFLPGAATVSEVMALLELGYTELKLFPAEASGGLGLLKSIHAPLPGARFCPTGGITAATAASYLALPNVGCVGGTWITPSDVIARKDWATVAELARAASALAPSSPKAAVLSSTETHPPAKRTAAAAR
ncbi:bifunctional 4-hydroxy-2-oxoglutarate aldolase/2-dehydro-3-deoxy-phosphogluconate aldolase [Arthrobacter ginkgonis]|uniref:2-dehydro-3-deoxy-phosphogluconate aldolase n=1 Tax=Arthrobacter ginkgonis TaxID=1630594 RepID=A0ABP7C3D6_9MICC